MRWILLPLLLAACTTPNVKPYGPAEPTLQDHVRYFEALYETNVIIPVTAEIMDIHFLGTAEECDTKGIRISYILYKYGPVDTVEEVVFHELGHCFFGRRHVKPTYFKNGPMKGCVTSIMAYSHMAVDHQCWQLFKPYYIKELATPGLCEKDFAYHGNCDRHYNANPNYFPSRPPVMRFTYGGKK